MQLDRPGGPTDAVLEFPSAEYVLRSERVAASDAPGFADAETRRRVVKLRRIVATTGRRDYGPRPRGILAPVSERMIWLVAMVDEFAGADGFEDVEIDQIVERLAWTPRERLDYLLDMLAFEERAHRARRIPAGS